MKPEVGSRLLGTVIWKPTLFFIPFSYLFLPGLLVLLFPRESSSIAEQLRILALNQLCLGLFYVTSVKLLNWISVSSWVKVYLIVGLLSGFNETIHVADLVQCLAHREPWVKVTYCHNCSLSFPALLPWKLGTLLCSPQILWFVIYSYCMKPLNLGMWNISPFSSSSGLFWTSQKQLNNYDSGGKSHGLIAFQQIKDFLGWNSKCWFLLPRWGFCVSMKRIWQNYLWQISESLEHEKRCSTALGRNSRCPSQCMNISISSLIFQMSDLPPNLFLREDKCLWFVWRNLIWK